MCKNVWNRYKKNKKVKKCENECKMYNKVRKNWKRIIK